MIEPIMYFGIGFLVAALVGLVVIPLVHGRAVRLTMRRLEAATPLSMAEIQADKDQLRAEFAMSTRRLEMNVEQLKAKTTSQLAEIVVRMRFILDKQLAVQPSMVKIAQKIIAQVWVSGRSRVVSSPSRTRTRSVPRTFRPCADSRRCFRSREPAPSRKR